MTDVSGMGGGEFYGRGRDDSSPGEGESRRGGRRSERGSSRRTDKPAESDMGLEFLRMAPHPLMEHPIRSLLSEVRDELTAFTRQSNRESGALGFGEQGYEPVSVAPIKIVCREAVDQLEAQFGYLGDHSILAVKFREIAQEAQTSIQEFDIYLTQSNFRRGLVPDGELTGVLLSANNLRGILGRKILEFDEMLTHIRRGS